jgi:hypothetical protein
MTTNPTNEPDPDEAEMREHLRQVEAAIEGMAYGLGLLLRILSETEKEDEDGGPQQPERRP